jgi:gliding motility-associated-like protein
VHTTVYTLEATSDKGCKGHGSLTVNVRSELRIPNTFTPNNDGNHDKWAINLQDFPACKVQVFTRTGKKIFESIGYLKAWDGNYKGNSLPPDTYYYIIELHDDKNRSFKGYVTIIK